MSLSPVHGSTAALLNSATVSRLTSSDSVSTFAEKLAGLLEGLLSGTSGGTHLEVDVDTVPGQNSGERQIIVSLKNSTAAGSSGMASGPMGVSSASTAGASAGASAAAAATVSVPATSPAAVPTLIEVQAAAAAKTAALVSAPATAQVVPPPSGPLKLASGKEVKNEYEAYWATQPPEVQKLMNISDETERFALAHELAGKGYSIDVPIMVWNWDPLATMVVRRNQGYTWIPSAGQESVKVAPGITFPGLTTYDPLHPPPGSIPVSLDFAKGFENTCLWLKPDEIYNS